MRMILCHEFGFTEEQDWISPHIFVILVTFAYRLGHAFKIIRAKNLEKEYGGFSTK